MRLLPVLVSAYMLFCLGVYIGLERQECVTDHECEMMWGPDEDDYQADVHAAG